MLTVSMSRILGIIETRIACDGIAPSIEEIMADAGYAGKGVIAGIIGRLVERGFITRTRKPRSIVVLRTRADVHAGIPVSDDPMVLFIHDHQRRNGGCSPSYREMCQALGVSSTNMIHRHLARLEREGSVVLSRGKTYRIIQVVKTTQGKEDGNDA